MVWPIPEAFCFVAVGHEVKYLSSPEMFNTTHDCAKKKFVRVDRAGQARLAVMGAEKSGNSGLQSGTGWKNLFERQSRAELIFAINLTNFSHVFSSCCQYKYIFAKMPVILHPQLQWYIRGKKFLDTPCICNIIVHNSNRVVHFF